MMTESDVLIVGAGGAGLSGGLMLARSRRKVTILDGGQPRNALASHMHGFLSRDGWSPLALISSGRAEVESYGATVESTQALSVAPIDSGFELTLASGDLHRTRRLLVTTGLRDELPSIPGLAAHWGCGVAHCPYCDGWEARDSRIAVIATEPGSVHQAQLLRQLSDRITYFTEATQLSETDRNGLRVRGIEIVVTRIARVIADGRMLAGLELEDGSRRPFDTVFVRPKAIPNDALLKQLGAAMQTRPDGQDWVVVDTNGRTSIAGVWAAGNVVNAAATVPVSAAAGSMAGTAINADLVAEDIAAAVR
ncbi:MULTISPECIES: NAD(P)/FAD-dependent oxidoreductase [unclassified Leifsonia]|uniref:NAD(P)/FAD-dependent oxidoreductase n=1 Tax=unclassified Leifsonia TaxID=2663824 RepID=UPI0008A7DD67|nr:MULTISPECIES: NAD(P)/FAD-dependent oxidoreductase [unclassified Leifsonia]SEH84243.1 Thioredoxin reductase [Leifsonia sp. CL154]SFL46910.1 Thioredoxin reductase [Leifsonia sp. CL147]